MPTFIAYPSSLPVPQAAPIQSTERRAIAPPGGPYDVRALQRDWHAEQQIILPPLNAADTAIFEAWWEDDLIFGGAWFAADWPLPQGMITGVRRMLATPHYEFIPTPQNNYWRISFPCEVRGRGELPQLLAPPAPHICAEGPVWHATVRPSGQSLAMVNLGDGEWFATGLGQAGSTPSPTLRSIDNGASWQAAGTIPNESNRHPDGLSFAPTVGPQGRLVSYYTSGATTSISGDRGDTWTNETHAIFVPIDLKYANGWFVFLNDSVTVPSAGIKVYATSDGLSPFDQHILPAQANSIHWIAAKSWWLIFERAGNRIWTSYDLDVWTLRGTNPRPFGTINRRNVAQLGLHVVAAFSDGTPTAIVSHDGGETWANTGTLIQADINCVASGNGIFLTSSSVGGQSSISIDNGDTWISTGAFTETKAWIFANDGDDTWVAVGGDGSNDTVANQGTC